MTTRSAFTSHPNTTEAARQLAEQFQGLKDVRGIVFFCSHTHDGAAISSELRLRYPNADVIGCTTAGEFVEGKGGIGGAVAMAFTGTAVNACYGAIARLEAGVEVAVTAAGRRLEQQAGVDLRKIDPSRYVGLVLVDGLHSYEEDVNRVLGNLAPLLTFVGGSAADNFELKETRVFYNGESSGTGAVLLLLDMRVPFTIVKTCSFEPTEHEFTVTRADTRNRVVYELDNRPVLDVYARALGVLPSQLDATLFRKRPLGLMLEGQPWIRSPLAAQHDGGLKFYCQIVEGTQVHIMRDTNLIEETATAMRKACEKLGRPATGGVVFNCAQRRLDLDAQQTHAAFLDIFSGFPTVGFHTYGESYLGHINQTCTALLFG